MTDLIRVAEEVATALSGGAPVVALESTVIAHGLPAPRNVEVGRSLEAELRAGGCVPATVGVLAGRAVIGLGPDGIARIGRGHGVAKLSSHELPLALQRGQDGATTVAATAWLAARAGISVFATGGIGGVHRGYPPDVSADLPELARTAMIVVCSGAKAILDLPATVEALESLGVLTVGWQTDAFPAFYSVDSGLSVDARVDDAQEVAELWEAMRALGRPGSLLVCVPPPADHALPADEVERAVQAALVAAEGEGVRGKQVTPFLLKSIAERTGGMSLEANTALLLNNARVAAGIARALASS